MFKNDIKAGKRILILMLAVATSIVFMPLSAQKADAAVSGDPTQWVIEHGSTAGTAAGTKSVRSTTIQSHTHNSRFAGYTKLKGIDVSSWQGSINWEKVKAAGVKFAIIRAGYRSYSSAGRKGTDPRYKYNIVNASAAGVKTGAYFFSQAKTVKEGEAEADYMIKLLEPYRNKISMPVVMDVEYAGAPGRLAAAKLSKAKQTSIALAFCKKIKAAGYTPMVYANTYFCNYKLYMSRIASLYPVWVAEWGGKCSYNGGYRFWQYSSGGSVNGIIGNVDRDIWYTKNLDQYMAYTGKAENLTADSGRVGKIYLKWSKAAGATRYAIYRAAGAGKFSKIKTVTGSTYLDTELRRSTNYSYRVLAMKGLSRGKISAIATGRTSDRGYTTRKTALRKGAHSTSGVIKMLAKGKTVTVISARKNVYGKRWYKVSVRIKGRTYKGWVYSKYIR